MALFNLRASRLRGVFGSLGVLAFAAVGLPGTASAATPTVLYASPSGSGSTCSVSAPCQPLKISSSPRARCELSSGARHLLTKPL